MAGERQTTIDLLPTATQPASDSAGTDLDTYWLTAPYPAERNSLRVPILETLASFTVILGGTMVDPEFSNTEPPSMRNFVNAFTLAPDWSDGDGHLINWVLHPEMGAEMYLLARNRDYPAWAAFAFSTVGSFAWEFLFEGWVEQPSGIDLALTSTAGAVLGEVRYQVREYLLTQPRSTWRDVGIVLADGIEAFHRAVAPPSPGLAPLAFDAPRTGPGTPEAATGLALTLHF
ncbi:MAG: DUF3943 domain-containing protein [bacterium]